MRHLPLGHTDLTVTDLCLGTMTWGRQNTLDEGLEQLDHALAAGINFIDTAEMYAVPAEAWTYGTTETIIGEWFARRKTRHHVVLATKIAGPGLPSWIGHIRGGKTRFVRDTIKEALDGSLRRLQTDHVDLYQLHWPERTTNFFGKLGYRHKAEEDFTPFGEVLDALDAEVRAGRIRHIGVSNETPWGLMRFLAEAHTLGLPRVATLQNPYSLLNRSAEIGLAEICHRESVGLLAYSPLAFGMLSGKYLDEVWPENGRLSLFKQFSRYTNPQAIAATRRYVALAREWSLDPSQMALAFVRQQGFVNSTIIGATSMEQLRLNIGSAGITLPAELLRAIEAIHTDHPNPAP
jgi:aryl-alcohol dehydrogenase-like predicted oxidoreductase